MSEDLPLTAETWEHLVTNGLEVELLEVAEDGGIEAARAWLTARGLTWRESPEPARPPRRVRRSRTRRRN